MCIVHHSSTSIAPRSEEASDQPPQASEYVEVEADEGCDAMEFGCQS